MESLADMRAHFQAGVREASAEHLRVGHKLSVWKAASNAGDGASRLVVSGVYQRENLMGLIGEAAPAALSQCCSSLEPNPPASIIQPKRKRIHCRRERIAFELRKGREGRVPLALARRGDQRREMRHPAHAEMQLATPLDAGRRRRGIPVLE